MRVPRPHYLKKTMLSCLTLPITSPCTRHTREFHFSVPGLTLTSSAITFSSFLLFLNKNKKVQPKWIWASVVILADHQIITKLLKKNLQAGLFSNSLIIASTAVTSVGFALTPLCSSYFSTNKRIATLGTLGLIGLCLSGLRIEHEHNTEKTGT